MKLIVGLGNPDKKYQNTRHNLGSNILKQFVETLHATSLTIKTKLSAQIYDCTGGPMCPPNHKTIFAIPTEYMNNSGLTVQKIAKFYKISPQDIYIIQDDLDLEVGDYKIQFDRGSAGHNGIKSIIENLGTQAFHRIRVGIGHPQSSVAHGAGDPVEDYVLQPFSKEEKEKIKNITTEIFTVINNL